MFTTEQVAAVGFDTAHTARNRLPSRRVLAKFRDAVRPAPNPGAGRSAWVGAAFIACNGQPVPRPG